MSDGTELSLLECYPEGVPEGFPVHLLGVHGGDMVETDADARAQIELVQAHLATLPQIDLPLTHYFTPDGVYARKIFMPKGSLVMGQVHLTGHLNIILQGDCTLFTTSGAKRIKAPCVFESSPGTKKMLYMNEDTIWMTTHVLPEQDTDGIEKQLAVTTYAEYEALTCAPSLIGEQECR